MDREAIISFLMKFCEGFFGCSTCPIHKEWDCCHNHCWAEMSDDKLAWCYEIATKNEAMKTEESNPADNVNHPPHYELPGGLECFDVIVATQGVESAKAFCLGNALKYLFRSQRKNGAEDIEKARWYLNKHHELTTK